MSFFYEYKDEKVIRIEFNKGEKPPLKGKKLKSLLKDDRKFSKEEIYLITEQLLEILDKMRSVFPPIVHKNINLSNIIVKKGLEIAIIGFGKNIKESRYSAPEIFDNPTPKVDLYSVGRVIKRISKNIKDKNFNTFLLKMSNEDPNERFNNTKIAKKIFDKIKNNTITREEFESNKKKESTLSAYDQFLLEKETKGGFNRSMNTIGLAKFALEKNDNFSAKNFEDNGDISSNSNSYYENERSPIQTFVLFIVIISIIGFFIRVFF